MNKNELIKWLKGEKEAAILAHRTTFESNQTKAREQLYESCGANYLINSLNELAAKERVYFYQEEVFAAIPCYWPNKHRGKQRNPFVRRGISRNIPQVRNQRPQMRHIYRRTIRNI